MSGDAVGIVLTSALGYAFVAALIGALASVWVGEQRHIDRDQEVSVSMFLGAVWPAVILYWTLRGIWWPLRRIGRWPGFALQFFHMLGQGFRVLRPRREKSADLPAARVVRS